MDKQLVTKLKLSFDDIAHTTEDGIEYWLARELQQCLGYTQWRRFKETIDRVGCPQSLYQVQS